MVYDRYLSLVVIRPRPSLKVTLFLLIIAAHKTHNNVIVIAFFGLCCAHFRCRIFALYPLRTLSVEIGHKIYPEKRAKIKTLKFLWRHGERKITKCVNAWNVHLVAIDACMCVVVVNETKSLFLPKFCDPRTKTRFFSLCILHPLIFFYFFPFTPFAHI